MKYLKKFEDIENEENIEDFLIKLEKFEDDYYEAKNDDESSYTNYETNKAYKKFGNKYNLDFWKIKDEPELFDLHNAMGKFEDQTYQSGNPNYPNEAEVDYLNDFDIFLKELEPWFTLKDNTLTKEILFRLDAKKYNV